MDTLAEYTANGYLGFTKADGTIVVYRFTSSGDRSLQGCLFVKSFMVNADGKICDIKVKAIDMTDLVFSCLSNDNDVDAYILQVI